MGGTFGRWLSHGCEPPQMGLMDIRVNSVFSVPFPAGEAHITIEEEDSFTKHWG